MRFKKFFSNVMAGLMASALFSNVSFAMEFQSTQQSLSEPSKIILIDKDTPKDKLNEYGRLRNVISSDGRQYYCLTDEFKNIYSLLETYKSEDGTINFVELSTFKRYRNKGYAKSLMVAVLNSYENKTISLVDDCDICNHNENFCFYEKFGFVPGKDEKDFDPPNGLSLRHMFLKKGENDIDYKGNKENLIKLKIIKL